MVLRPNFLFPKYMDVWLEAPDGTIVRPADAGTVNMRFVQQNTHLYFRCQFPVVPGRIGTHAGRWRVWVRNLTGRVQTSAAVVAGAGGAPLVYSVMAKARSDLRLGGRLRQSSYAPGSSMFVTLEPTLYGLPVAVSEPVRVDVLRPDGAPRSLVLARTADGTYEGTYVDTPLIGPYLFTAEVSARTPLGHTVTRFRQLTGIIFKPGRGPGGGNGGHNGGGHDGGGDGPCDEKCCEEILVLLRRLEAVLERCCRERSVSVRGPS